LFSFLAISIFIITLSWYLSGRITKAIVRFVEFISAIDFNQPFQPMPVLQTNDEVEILTRRFNELMTKMNEVFSFQKHAVHHISHELKTPIAILVSNFDRIEQETDTEKLRELVLQQKEGTRNLSEIINALLEIAKVESGSIQHLENIRIDELIFDIMEELQQIYPLFHFKIDYSDEHISDAILTISGNKRLLHAVFQNLMLNSIHYSDDAMAYIELHQSDAFLEIRFRNSGMVISEREQAFLFQHFFRGNNSKGKRGFGLGLVLINKILKLHRASIEYMSRNKNENIFIIRFPLS
jgi:signal transduction histidine kinase